MESMESKEEKRQSLTTEVCACLEDVNIDHDTSETIDAVIQDVFINYCGERDRIRMLNINEKCVDQHCRIPLHRP